MYNEGDQEDKEIAAAQTRAAALREELSEGEEESPSPEAAPGQEATPEAQTPYRIKGAETFPAGSAVQRRSLKYEPSGACLQVALRQTAKPCTQLGTRSVQISAS